MSAQPEQNEPPELELLRMPVATSSAAGRAITEFAKYGSRNRLSTRWYGAIADPSQPLLPPGPAWADDAWYRLRHDLACVSAARPEAIGSQVTAALLRGWPIPRRLLCSELTVTVPKEKLIRRAGVRIIRSDRYDPHSIYSVRLNRGDYVLYELARVLDIGELIYVIDAICGTWKTNPVTTVQRVRKATEATRGIIGKQKLLAALGLARDRVGSPRETQLRLAIVRAGLPEPVVCTPIQLPRAAQLYHPDLAYRGARIAIEYEGAHHRTDDWQWNHDIERERAFRTAGWEYFRVTNRTHMPDFLAELAAALKERSGS